MSLPDDHIEHLLAELVAGRLDPDGEAQLRRSISERPELAHRFEEIRRDAEIRSFAHEVREDDGSFPSNAMLAMFLNGALSELYRASLEAELSGDAAAQQRLLALHREVAAADGSPLPEVPAGSSSNRASLVPSDKFLFQKRSLLRFMLGAIGAVLVFISLFLPPAAAQPILFLGLAAFIAWVVFRNRSFEFRVQRLLGLLPALVLFGLGLVAGPWAVWCYVGSAAAYWYWLLRGRRGHVKAPVEEPKES